MWAGLACHVLDNNKGIEVAISIHDGTYSTDYAAAIIPHPASEDPNAVEKHIITTLKKFSETHLCKFLGAGVTLILLDVVPNLCTRLWKELDIVPIVFNIQPFAKDYSHYKPKRNLLSPDADKFLSIPPTYSSIPPSSAESEASEEEEEEAHHHKKHYGLISKLTSIPRTLDEQSGTCLARFALDLAILTRLLHIRFRRQEMRHVLRPKQ